MTPRKKENQMRNMMEELLKKKDVRENMFTNATDEAI
jgi:hypothetical protein